MRIRAATADDVTAMAKVRIDTWRSAYAGIVPSDHLESLSYDRTAEGWRSGIFASGSPDLAAFVAEEADGQIAGIAICGPAEGLEGKGTGQVHVLYVLPGFQRRGVGRSLMQRCGRHLVSRGYGSLVVWVLKDNPYREFYEGLSGVQAGEKLVEIGDASLVEVAYEWSEIHKAPWMSEDTPRQDPDQAGRPDAA